MTKRADEIKKRIAKRKKQRQQQVSSSSHLTRRSNFLASEEEKHGFPPFSATDDDFQGKEGPMFRKEIFVFQLLISIALFFVVGIIFKSDTNQWQNAKSFVQQSMEQEFQFAAVSSWYEDNFGQPLSLLPLDDTQNQQTKTQYVNSEYAIPASGSKILQSFDANGQGVMLETAKGSDVEAIDGGLVVFAGKKDNLGKSVIIQHADGSESWYGNLETIDVSLYDYIESRAKVGKVMNSENGQSGKYYFAIKKGENFIDPIQVISFD